MSDYIGDVDLCGTSIRIFIGLWIRACTDPFNLFIKNGTRTVFPDHNSLNNISKQSELSFRAWLRGFPVFDRLICNWNQKPFDIFIPPLMHAGLSSISCRYWNMGLVLKSRLTQNSTLPRWVNFPACPNWKLIIWRITLGDLHRNWFHHLRDKHP